MIGQNVLKLASLLFAGGGSIYMIHLGYVEVAAGILGAMVGFTVGEVNGQRNRKPPEVL
jgi:hypothetical protein